MGILTLGELLLSREKRSERQYQWLTKYKSTVISFTLNIPGNNKVIPASEKIFELGFNLIIAKLGELGFCVLNYDKFYLPTGSEAIFAVHADAFLLKKEMVLLEEFEFGRVFDIDVITFDREDKKIISRKELKLPPRLCYVCCRPAFICAREKSHPLEILLMKIDKISELI